MLLNYGDWMKNGVLNTVWPLPEEKSIGSDLLCVHILTPSRAQDDLPTWDTLRASCCWYALLLDVVYNKTSWNNGSNSLQRYTSDFTSESNLKVRNKKRRIYEWIKEGMALYNPFAHYSSCFWIISAVIVLSLVFPKSPWSCSFGLQDCKTKAKAWQTVTSPMPRSTCARLCQQNARSRP